jgi:uncharacterized membrane protein YgcG
MVRGIATDDKRYKHIYRDEKWLTKDLHDIKKTIEHYIDSQQPAAEKESTTSLQKSTQRTMTVDRIIAIIFLGIFGSITLLTGLFLVIKQPSVFTGSLVFIGVIFIICYLLFEYYR